MLDKGKKKADERGRKTEDQRSYRKLLEAEHFADAFAMLDFIKSVAEDQAQPMALRLEAADKYICHVIGRPRQAVDMEQHGSVVVNVTSSWTPN